MVSAALGVPSGLAGYSSDGASGAASGGIAGGGLQRAASITLGLHQHATSSQRAAAGGISPGLRAKTTLFPLGAVQPSAAGYGVSAGAVGLPLVPPHLAIPPLDCRLPLPHLRHGDACTGATAAAVAHMASSRLPHPHPHDCSSTAAGDATDDAGSSQGAPATAGPVVTAAVTLASWLPLDPTRRDTGCVLSTASAAGGVPIAPGAAAVDASAAAGTEPTSALARHSSPYRQLSGKQGAASASGSPSVSLPPSSVGAGGAGGATNSGGRQVGASPSQPRRGGGDWECLPRCHWVSEEERRLAYVALTRARSKLTLLFCTLRRVAVQRRKPAAGAAVNAHGQPLVAHTFTLQRVPPSAYLTPLYDLRRSVRLRVLSDEEREAVASQAASAGDLDSICGLLGLFVDPGLTHIVG